MKKKKEVVYAFIDSQNVNLGVKSQGWSLDFGRFRVFLKELVLHTMIRYRNYSQAIIVSGDGDFHCLVEYLEKYGKLKKIIVPNKKYSSLLRKFASYIVNINQFKEKLKQ